MNRNKKQTGRKSFLLMIGILLSIAFLFSGVEAAKVGNHLNQPLSFNSIGNFHSLINVDGIVFMFVNSPKPKPSTTPTTTTTDKKKTTTKSGKKDVKDQKNSTSRRRAIIDD